MVCRTDVVMKKALLSQCVFQDASDRRAKDGEIELAVSERVVGMERMVGRRVARAEPLAPAGGVDGRPLCPGTSHRDHLAPRRRNPPRLYCLLLLPGQRGTQDRIGLDAAVAAGAQDAA